MVFSQWVLSEIIMQQTEGKIKFRKTVESNGTDDFFFSYDVDGSLISFNLNGEDYFCITNQLGDISALVDENGAEVASLEYNAYGNLLSSSGSVKSPITYRGYRYDWEIGMYYLNSRYYNSQTGRFLNSDGLLGQTGDILSSNMYAYCVNNPIANVDPSGYLSFGRNSWNSVWTGMVLNQWVAHDIIWVET